MDWIQRHSSVFNSTSCKLRFLDIQVRRTGTGEHLAFFAFPFTILPAWQDRAGSGSPVRLAALMQHIEPGGQPIMYFERILIANVQGPRWAEHDFTAKPGTVRRWNLLPWGAPASRLLRGLAMAGLGRRQADRFRAFFSSKGSRQLDSPVHLEVIQVRHAPQERGATSPARRQVGWCLGKEGWFEPLPIRRMRLRDSTVAKGLPEPGKSSAGRLLVGYGATIRPLAGTDCYDILPTQRLRRCAGLFDSRVGLTNPLAFLRRLRFKGKYRAGRAHALLARLAADLSGWMGWDIAGALGEEGQLEALWAATPRSRRAAAELALDMVRHVYDASYHLEDPDPLQQPGVVLLDKCEAWCELGLLPRFFQLLDGLLPQVQFFITLSPAGARRFPAKLRNQTLPIPVPLRRGRAVRRRRLPSDTVLLVDVDGTLPNLALMKLSRHVKNLGGKVALARGINDLPPADLVRASCVFSTPASARHVEVLRERYNGRLEVGGSGVDLHLRLAPEVEQLAPDYSLYPELDGRALGFLTRGCSARCAFCLVPAKEGPPRLVSDLAMLLQGRRKLILLDDNLLAHPAALELLEEMARQDLEVNFNQTLDLRLLTRESAALLRRIRCANAIFTRRVYHFSLNDARHLDLVRERYALLQTTGRDNAEFICMYGFNTSLDEDVRRFRFLRALPGAYVFVQRYQPVPGGPAPDLSRLFDHRAEALMDELVRILFPQNMKSMETYYRWLALQYAAQRGRIHYPLLETLFRFNGRPRLAGFLDKLQQLAASAPKTPGRELDPKK